MIIHNPIQKVSPFRLIISTEPMGEPCIACPVCGKPWVHIVSCAVAMNHTTVIAERDDATVIRTTKDSPRRGSRIEIKFVGECLHEFTYAISFHKGNSYVELLDVADVPPSKFPACLWRD